MVILATIRLNCVDVTVSFQKCVTFIWVGQLAGNHADYEVASSLPLLNALANSLIREYLGSHELMIAPVISLSRIYRYTHICVYA